MVDIDGIIRRRERVKLNKAQRTVIEQLYGDSIIEDTIVEKIGYLSDGLVISGYIARPRKEGPFPVLIWNRGGSGVKGALTALNAYLLLASTAVWGYLVLGTQYRGNMDSEGEEDWGGGDLTDSLNLIKVARNIQDCDTDRIAVEGPSRGGMTTYRAVKEYRKFKCAVVHAGIADVGRLVETKPSFAKFVEKRFGGLSAKERDEAIKSLSAVHFAKELPKDVPFLIMHGSADSTVPIEQSELIVRELEKYGIPHKYVVLEGGTHVALKDGSYREMDRHRRAWLDKYLKPSDREICS
jgi:dipeptidyl aminopeptidase/acylaminoacyl peptidase